MIDKISRRGPCNPEVLFAAARNFRAASLPPARASAAASHKRGSAPEAAATVPRYTDTNAALLTGLATLLQQLPRLYKDEVLRLCGAHIVAVCAGAESKEKDIGKEVADSGRLAELLGDLLDLLGLPREQLAEYVPQGLLDLMPAEGV